MTPRDRLELILVVLIAVVVISGAVRGAFDPVAITALTGALGLVAGSINVRRRRNNGDDADKDDGASSS